MIEKDSQLLCTFSTLKTYLKEIESISEIYEILGARIYVLENSDNTEEIFLTFSAAKASGKYHPRTISVHRKKDHNILYSINALNELIREENSGSFSSQFDINWGLHTNSLITVKDGKLKVTPTKLVTIFHL